MTPRKNTATPGQHISDLRAKLHEALETTSTDDELAARMITNGALGIAVRAGTYTTEETARALGIGIRSVRSLATKKTTTFPKPTITERRYARNDVETYARTRQKRTPRTTQESSD